VRKELYGKIYKIVNEEGGVICPMFNDFIDAHSTKVAGWIENPNYEMSGGFASSTTWFA
jgi:peptide/nickel transport system substrate-binding protein